MEFDPGVAGTEAPVDADAGCVAASFVGRDGALQCVASGFRPLRQERFKALNSISAIFSQLACLGVG